MTGTTLLDWIQGILRDPAERAAFQADPDDYADRHGFGDLSPADVHDALWLIADNQSASWEHGNGQVHYPPPPPIHQHVDHAGGYLNSYITGNYATGFSGDDQDTDVDSSVHQDVRTDDDHRDPRDHDDRDHDSRDDHRDHGNAWDDGDLWSDGDLWDGEGERYRHDGDDSDGGDLHQHLHADTVVASGAGATAVGGDNGSDNAGDIASTGHDGATAFGAGDAAHADFAGIGAGSGIGSDTEFGAGSAVNVGDGSASGDAHTDTHRIADGSFQDNDTTHVEDGDRIDLHTSLSDDPQSDNPLFDDHLSGSPLDGGRHDTDQADQHDQVDHTHFDNV